MVDVVDSSFINPNYFKDDFCLDAFLVNLTQDVIDPRKQQQQPQQQQQQRQQQPGNAWAASSAEAAQATLDRVQKLLRRFSRAEEEIAGLCSEVADKLFELQQSGQQHEAEYKAEVAVLERAAECIRDGIRDVDARVSAISQTATRIGDRLQTAEGVRVRCLEAQELISHLQAFSCHAAVDDFRQLPQLFTSEATMAEAAAVSRRMLLLASEVLAAAQRSKMASLDTLQMNSPGNTGGIGSVEHAIKVLEAYCNWLENRVVSRFDAAVADGNLQLQAACVAIMRELGKEKAIAQRWVASRPMFLAFSPSMLDDWLRRASRPSPLPAHATRGSDDASGGGAAAGTASASNDNSDSSEDDIVGRYARALSALYKDMHAAVKAEVAAAQQAFPVPGLALELFVSRLLEQNVQAALERLLLPSGVGMAALTAAAAASGAPGSFATLSSLGSTNSLAAVSGTVAAVSAASPPAKGTAAGAAAASPSPPSAASRVASFRERASSLAASFTGPSAAAAAAAASSALTPRQAAELQRQRLRLLAESYGRTARLAVNLERAVKAACQLDVVNMAEGLWPAFMGAYPEQELAWLQAAYEAEVALQDSPELNLAFCSKVMAWHKEATARCQKLSAPGQGSRNCRMLFHHLVPAAGTAAAAAAAVASPPDAAAPVAHPGCLLEHLARHIIGGVEYSLELCTASGSGSLGSSLFKMGFGSVSRASSSQMAAAFVNDKIRKALEAAHVAADIMSALQAHFSGVVAPALLGSVSELSAASSALLSLIRAAEDSITVVLRKCVDAFMAQFERVLAAEQRKSDFLPRDDELSFDKPTPACLLGTALLLALGAAARDTLEGANSRHFLAEVARRSHQVLLLHMTRFCYSPTGALKWKKDANEYAEVLATYQVPSANEDMSQLQQLVNVLVVAPESLVGLVNGSLRMPHRDALRFIALREDFKTASVGGKSLLQLFSGEGMEGQISQMAAGSGGVGGSPARK